MNRLFKSFLIGLIVLPLAFAPAVAFAKAKGPKKEEGKMPSGFTQGEKKGWGDENTPPGWTQGEKTGWQEASTPPGLTQASAEQKEQNRKSKKSNKAKREKKKD